MVKKIFYFLILFNLKLKLIKSDVHVLPRDCDSERYNNFNDDNSIPTKNLIFESSLHDLKFVLNCTFCDHLIYGRDIKHGKWYLKRRLEGKYELIDQNSENFKILEDNQLKIENYRKNTGFYSCYPDNPSYNIRIQTLVDYIEKDKLLEKQFKFDHQEQFTNFSLNLIEKIENEIRLNLINNFNDKYKLVYVYYKDTMCSKCDQIGIKDMVFKCKFSELSFYKSDNSRHVEPSVSCDSKLIKSLNNKLYNLVKNLQIMSFKFTCNISCVDARLPNLTEISVTEKPGILSIFEIQTKRLLTNLLLKVGIYPVPNSIKPDFNLTFINIQTLIDRPFELICPFNKLTEDDNLIFWYFNTTLISSLKLRIITDNNCKIKKNKLIFNSMQSEYNGSYICTYMEKQIIEFRLNVENYSKFDLRDPFTIYLITLYLNIIIFIIYNIYQLIIKPLLRRKYKRNKKKYRKLINLDNI